MGGGGRGVGWVCFFFQAEDGIRDYDVTGVQTCALPISISQCCGQSEYVLGMLFTALALQINQDTETNDWCLQVVL